VGSWDAADGVFGGVGGRPSRALAVPVGAGDLPRCQSQSPRHLLLKTPVERPLIFGVLVALVPLIQFTLGVILARSLHAHFFRAL